jgi:predicted transcriptional regulator
MKKYIQDSILLTKEAIADSILRQRVEQATRYGLTLEEYMRAIEKGEVLTPVSSSAQQNRYW